MKKVSALILSLFFLGLVISESAEAGRRFGGGKSFGSKPTYEQPASPQRQMSQPGVGGGFQTPPSRGFLGGLGGMVGGFLMGGLIGSLLFGGMGAFSGPGLMDILLLGGLLFLLFRFLKSRRTPAMQPSGGMSFDTGAPGRYSTDSTGSNSRWGAPGNLPYNAPQFQPVVPAGFNVPEFLKGAKTAFNRLQSSWDKRDFEDLKHFTSPEVLAELRRQAEEDPIGGQTEIVSVAAELLEVREANDEIVASVLFDSQLREDTGRKDLQQVREVWHFRRRRSAAESFWILEGIQQTL